MKIIVLILGFGLTVPACAGTLQGHVRDVNWFARYQTNAPGVGQYEYAVSATAAGSATGAGATGTDVFGVFSIASLPSGNYNVASWDVWWRSSFQFNVFVPTSGSSADVDLRLRSGMWGYPAFWSETGYTEFGQTFTATGPVTMIYVRNPLQNSPAYTLTIHESGPTGPQIGVSRVVNGYWDNRIIYGYGQMPTINGRTYYARFRTSNGNGILCQMDPRPDFSDSMPGGWLFLGDSTGLKAYPDRDLGLVIMCDDDGLITNLFTRHNNQHVDGTSVGQTFIARGVNLISAAFWLNDPAFPSYIVRLFRDGQPVGPSKRGRVGRPGADPQMLVIWSPGECPLEPGQSYYVEVTRDGGGPFSVALVNTSDPYPYGQAFRNGAALVGTDLAGTLLEEEMNGRATRPSVRFASEPTIAEPERGATNVTVRWTTDVPSDSRVDYAPQYPPYIASVYSPTLVTEHAVQLPRLEPHTLYHFQVRSEASAYNAAVSRDFVSCTRNRSTNLLVNASFEAASGTTPQTLIPGWTEFGIDLRASRGNWFFSLAPTNDTWFCQGAVNGSDSDGYLYQRVTGIEPGLDYTFSASILTAMRENSAWKYDVWDRRDRLIYARLGIDPTGGTNINATTVQWTPRLYSHLRYTRVAKTVLAETNQLTVFVRMSGQGGEWHLYGVDDCVLSHEEVALEFGPTRPTPTNRLELTLFGKARLTNVVEASTNFINWRSVGSVVNTNGAVRFTIPSLTNFPVRFFRAR